MMASRKKEMIIDCNETPASYNNWNAKQHILKSVEIKSFIVYMEG
jgi:hypothetical protein